MPVHSQADQQKWNRWPSCNVPAESWGRASLSLEEWYHSLDFTWQSSTNCSPWRLGLNYAAGSKWNLFSVITIIFTLLLQVRNWSTSGCRLTFWKRKMTFLIYVKTVTIVHSLSQILVCESKLNSLITFFLFSLYFV